MSEHWLDGVARRAARSHTERTRTASPPQSAHGRGEQNETEWLTRRAALKRGALAGIALAGFGRLALPEPARADLSSCLENVEGVYRYWMTFCYGNYRSRPHSPALLAWYADCVVRHEAERAGGVALCRATNPPPEPTRTPKEPPKKPPKKKAPVKKKPPPQPSPPPGGCVPPNCNPPNEICVGGKCVNACDFIRRPQDKCCRCPGGDYPAAPGDPCCTR